MNPKIFLLAGEASGDHLGADVIQAILKKNPNAELYAMGGKAMQSAGAQLILDSSALAVVGIWEVITHFRVLRNAFNFIKQQLIQKKPDVVILIDYPGFNLRIAKIAKSLGCKVIFYVSPQIWAWRYHRIHHIRRYIDHMIVFFAFEQAIYERENIPVSLVAHPLVKITAQSFDKSKLLSELNLDPNEPIIALLPGSRQQEIRNLTPILLQTKTLIKTKIPNAQFVLPVASSINPAQIQAQVDQEIHVTQTPAYQVLSISQAAIVASGTATLEAALCQIPTAIVYKIWGYHLAKRWIIKTPYIGLCNIAAQQLIAKEFIEKEAKPELIADEIINLINDPIYRSQVLEKLKSTKAQLGSANAADCVAKLALDLSQTQ